MVSPLNHGLHRLTLRITQIFLFVFCVYSLMFGENAPESKHIRVAIVQDATSIRLKVKGFYEIVDSPNQRVLYRGKDLKTTVTAYKDGILVGTVNLHSPKALIRPQDADAIVINDRQFKGDIQLIKDDHAKLSVINHIELEDYIKGILYHEVSHYWPMEALQAQATVCRTYAAYQIQENAAKDYDSTSDIYSQVYGGKTSERYRTNRAVDKTKGLVLTYKNRVFPAYYHATCSGHTEDASLLWDIDIVPLRGVACSFCQDSPHFNWHYVLSLGEVEDKLVKAGYRINKIEDIRILGRDKSGRITDLKIASLKREIKISAKDFRNIIGPNIIRSTNFTVHLANHEVVFEGLGWGHGVGLCQWGAYFMAKQGYTAEQILKYYYPQSDVGTLRF